MSEVWTPSQQRSGASHLSTFAERYGPELPSQNFAALHRWSIEQPQAFWPALVDYAGLITEGDLHPVVDDVSRLPGAKWFPNLRLNLAENLLMHRGDAIALVASDETGHRVTLTRDELAARVTGFAEWLREFGLQPGDRVAGWLGNGIEAVIGMLGTAAVGGVWTSCSPDFGLDGAQDRFGQVEPRLLIACAGYHYGGKAIEVASKAQALASQVSSIEQVLWVAGGGCSIPAGGQSFDTASPTTDPDELTPVRLPFDAPLYVMYSSGTTGVPKCILHSHGGSLLQHSKEHLLHVDLHSGSRIGFFTTCGWMMWNWLVSALVTGARVALYDGSPSHPQADVLFAWAESEKLTHLGTSPKYLSALASAGAEPKQRDLTALTTLLSTGSPLTEDGYRYIYQSVKEDIQIASISGGTDLLSCFVGGNPWQSVRSGEITGPMLGMDVVVVRDDGELADAGEPGELVCRQSFPSVPIGFWGDSDGSRFRTAYFERFEGLWAQGDFATRTDSGGFVIHGRSDATLNPGGVRIGSAEITRQVARVSEVIDCVCVGQLIDGDSRIVLGVVLRDGHDLSTQLTAKIRATIREHTTPRHVPSVVFAVTDVPRTLSGKVAEIAVRDTIAGRPVGNTSALANPEALTQYANRPELSV